MALKGDDVVCATKREDRFLWALDKMDASDETGKADNVPLTHGEARWTPTLFLYALLANKNNSEVGPRF